MKNYVQLWIAVQTDGLVPPAVTSSGAFTDFDSAQAFADAKNGAVQSYYFLLNKFRVATYVSFFCVQGNLPDANAKLPVSDDAWTQDRNAAQNWGGDQPLWNYDTLDPRSVLAHDAAIKTRNTGANAIAKKTLTINILQALTLTYIALTQEAQRLKTTLGAEAGAAATLILQIINNLSAGKITDAQAAADYQKVVDRFPDLFLH